MALKQTVIIPNVSSQTTNVTDTVNTKVLFDIISNQSKGIPFDPKSVIESIDISDSEGLNSIQNHVVNVAKMLTKSEWKHMISTKRVIETLGVYPNTATDYVSSWIASYGIIFDGSGNVKSCKFKNDDIEKMQDDISRYKQSSNENEESNVTEGKISILKGAIASRTSNVTTVDILRKMRISRDDLMLVKFKDKQIDDCLEEYVTEMKNHNRARLYISVAHDISVDYTEQENVWNTISEALFDNEENSKQSSIAILKKFIWQVKRKMIGKPVTNHIMPIILGKQGTGKTTFITNLISPIDDLTAPTDFQQITDSRNMSIFEKYVLFVDEMGFASKSDVDLVKNVITAEVIGRRPLHTNAYVNVRQCATLIGASNRNMDQLIRDETGNRRFAPIDFRNDPDWEAVKDIDYRQLWAAIDENGQDPSIGFIDEIRERQEMSRVKSSCEEWIHTLTSNDNKPDGKNIEFWFERFHEWEEKYYYRRMTDLSTWAMELRRICKAHPDLGFRNLGQKYKKTIFSFNWSIYESNHVTK